MNLIELPFSSPQYSTDLRLTHVAAQTLEFERSSTQYLLKATLLLNINGMNNNFRILHRPYSFVEEHL